MTYNKDGSVRKNSRTWSQVVQVRLSPEEFAALQRVRFDFGSGPPQSAAACARSVIRRYLMGAPVVQELPLAGAE